MAKPVPNPNVKMPEPKASRWSLIVRSPEGLGLFSAKGAPDAIYLGCGSGEPDACGNVPHRVTPAILALLLSTDGHPDYTCEAAPENGIPRRFRIPAGTVRYLIARGWSMEAGTLARAALAEWLDAFRLTL